MKNPFRYALLISLLIATIPCSAAQYSETWASVGTHVAAPEWFQDAKFGLWFHWGAYTVPAYGYEWYPRNMYKSDDWSGTYKHHVDTYGDPMTDWPYNKFIDGGYDKKGNWVQFAPKLSSQGGKFDPDSWAELFDSAGAKIAGPVAEHHDGFSLWASKVNPWNSLAKGPKVDLVKALTDAFRSKGMKVMISMHHAWNTTGYYESAPAQTDETLKKLFGQLTTAEAEQVWLEKLKEVIDGYQPDYIWQDHNVVKMSESTRLKFLAYYYNKEADWGKEVVASYNDGFNTNTAVKQYERGGPADLTTPFWLSEDAISSSTWSYIEGMKYYTSTVLLHRLLDIVSKNGNLILNISPKADGTIPTEQRTILLAMGDWLRKFGSAIYGTRAWSVYGEGPTKMGGGSFSAPVAGTGEDIRYTRTKDTSAVYAIFLGWPGNNANVTLTGLSSSKLSLTSESTVGLMLENSENTIPLTFSQGSDGLHVTFPSSAPYSALAYPIVIQVRPTRDPVPSPRDTVFNGSFNEDSYGWKLNVWHGGASSSVVNGECRIDIDSVGTSNYQIQLIQSGITLTKGKSYEVSFDAYALASRTLEFNVEKDTDPWTSYLTALATLDLTNTKKRYSVSFVMTEPTDSIGRISFNLGASDITTFIDNVQIKVKSSVRIMSALELQTGPVTYQVFDLQGHALGTVVASDLPSLRQEIQKAFAKPGCYIVRSPSANGSSIQKIVIEPK